jgi:hypothetical protein
MIGTWLGEQPTPLACHVERSETSLIVVSAAGEGIKREILRFAQNDNDDDEADQSSYLAKPGRSSRELATT